MKNLKVLIADIEKVWEPKRFGITRHPHPVGKINEKECFIAPKRNVLDMPIKTPYSDVRIPEDLETPSILEIVKTCLDFEKCINTNWEQYYMYLTVHHSYVEKQTTQRRSGAHIDGMQGERYIEKIPACHSYLVSNVVPTRFFNHPFPKNLCERTQNWFYEFDKVKDESKSSLSKPYEINLMTAYNVHESTAAATSGLRTFVRLEFSLKKFDRVGNSMNPLFDLDWEYKDRSIPKHLAQGLFD
ncbi:hypothetical protein bcgnr5378_05580 [Bacillus cereus]|uniref:Uncharacterized protein n=1 Tax=Bacillus cereus TaxID=1396 RepID=A0A164LCG0_BACCE|nr:hypothetical protein [Bacillus cereus]KZD55664.1 hypothetical protein B4088_5409 [Bacillus cereus]